MKHPDTRRHRLLAHVDHTGRRFQRGSHRRPHGFMAECRCDLHLRGGSQPGGGGSVRRPAAWRHQLLLLPAGQAVLKLARKRERPDRSRGRGAAVRIPRRSRFRGVFGVLSSVCRSRLSGDWQPRGTNAHGTANGLGEAYEVTRTRNRVIGPPVRPAEIRVLGPCVGTFLDGRPRCAGAAGTDGTAGRVHPSASGRLQLGASPSGRPSGCRRHDHAIE